MRQPDARLIEDQRHSLDTSAYKDPLQALQPLPAGSFQILNQYLQPLNLRKLNKMSHPVTEGGAYPEKTLTPQFESPNGLWRRLGYAVERGPRGARTIRRPDGSEVGIDSERGRHTGEIEAAQQELARVPRGQGECHAAQLDIFT